MKIITTNLLNRFWVNGVKPIQTAVAKKLDTAKIANNRTTTASGYALDARQGKALQDAIDELNSNIAQATAYEQTTLKIPYSNNSITLVKLGRLVIASGNVQFSSSASLSYTKVNEVVPEGYRPVFGNAAIVFGHCNFNLLVDTDGAMKGLGDVNSSTFAPATGSWITQ